MFFCGSHWNSFKIIKLTFRLRNYVRPQRKPIMCFILFMPNKGITKLKGTQVRSEHILGWDTQREMLMFRVRFITAYKVRFKKTVDCFRPFSQKKIARGTTGAKDFYSLQNLIKPRMSKFIYSSSTDILYKILN